MKHKFKKDQLQLFKRYLEFLFPYRKKQFLILCLSGAAVLTGLAVPYLTKMIVDTAVSTREIKKFILLGSIAGGTFILSGILSATADYFRRAMSLNVRYDLNKKVFSHLQELPLEFFKNKSTGEHMFKLENDIDGTVDLIVSIPEDIVRIFPKLVIIFGILFYLDWRMALFSLFFAPVLYIPLYVFTHRMRKLLIDLFAHSEGIFKRMEEVFSHIYLVKAYGKEKAETQRYLRTLKDNIGIRMKNIRLEVANSFVGEAFKRIVIGLITLFGGYLILRGGMSTGTLVAVLLYISQMVGLQSALALFIHKTTMGLVSCGRLDELFNEIPKMEYDHSANKRDRIVIDKSNIEFRNVSFSYQKNKKIFDSCSFTFDVPFAALTGPSGCGKTTLLNLIMQLYLPQDGHIFISDFDSRNMDPSFLRSQIGVALQEPFLWNDTIKNNIRYGRDNATDQEIENAVLLTGIDKFALDLPEGIETVIGENACKLSEGQKQRIAIARAWIKKPKILIFDEAMSSMDSASEERILENIKKKAAHSDMILIIVSHRLSAVLKADTVYYLSDPFHMEIDIPLSLLKNNSRFRELFSGQIND